MQHLVIPHGMLGAALKKSLFSITFGRAVFRPHLKMCMRSVQLKIRSFVSVINTVPVHSELNQNVFFWGWGWKQFFSLTHG